MFFFAILYIAAGLHSSLNWKPCYFFSHLKIDSCWQMKIELENIVGECAMDEQ